MNPIIIKQSNNLYILETDGHILKGYFKRINETTTEVNLYNWYDKTTKRHKTSKNKLFCHMTRWFCYMLEKYGNL